MAESKTVTVSSTNKAGPLPAVICGNPQEAPGLIVLQEWWGMNDQIKACGKDIHQRSSFVTIVPDLYRGKLAKDHEEAGHLMSGLDWKGAVEDIQACARFLKDQGCKKVGVTGFCMGGALSMATAALVPEVDAAVPFYGIPSAELCDVTKITIPLQCHFAEKDETFGFASPKEWGPLKEKLEGSLKQLDFHSYDAPHAFTNKSRDTYRPECAELAYDRMFKFFNKHLRS